MAAVEEVVVVAAVLPVADHHAITVRGRIQGEATVVMEAMEAMEDLALFLLCL